MTDTPNPSALAMLRKLAAYAAYAVDGVWPQYDPYPDRVDALCESLKSIGAAALARQEEPECGYDGDRCTFGGLSERCVCLLPGDKLKWREAARD